MGKRNLQPDNHSIDPCPFEAFWWGSWQTVERLRIQEGAIFMHILKNGEILEENIPIGNLRMKSRRANMSDCTCFLRPGIHICVLLTPEKTEESDTDENPEPVWTDAKISSIERKPHEDKCECKFYINFYVSEDPFNMAKKKLSKDIEVVQIDRISILQRLEQKPIENEYYRWEFTDDCSSRQKFKLFTGKFSSDLSWMVVTSVLKQLVFDVQSIGSRIVYQISDCDDDDDVANPEHGQQRCCRNAITFRVDNELTTSVLVPMAAPEEAVGPHHEDGLDRGPRSVYDLGGLRRSKRRYVQPDRYLACDDAALLELLDTDTTRVGIQKTSRYEYIEMPMALSIQADHACQFEGQNGNENMLIPYEQNYRNAVFETQHKHKPKTKPGEEKTFSEQSENCPIPLDTDIPEDCSRDIRDLISDCGYTNGSSSVQKKRNSDSDLLVGMGGGGWEGKESKKRGRKRKRNPGVRESIYDVRSFKKGSVSASLYRELIKRCMRNIEAEKHKEQPPIIDQWKEFQRLNQQKEFEKTPSNFYKFKDEEEEEEEEEEEGGGKKKEEEDPELEMLWKEMELAMASTYFLDDNEGSHVEDPAKGQMLGKRRGRACRHEYKLNEEIGIICRFCGFVAHEIRDVRPSFVPFTMWAGNKERATDETSANDQKPETDDHDLFNIPNSKNGPTSEPEEEEDNNVWALIPDLKPKLRFHQKRAFEFLWRNLAGSILPAQMEPASKMRGGCVISHSPGAGKTLLIIAFLVSYLKLFPGSRPLVLAPKTTLYTWYKEIIKWEIPVPVYQIHGGQTYKGEVIRQKIKLAPGIPRNQDVMHVLDCLEKIQKWLANPSVLLMGYTSFLTLTREDSKNAHRQYMARVLKQCPGILILDEGHNPRSTKSRLRKALMKVETGLRVLLSGTLFQNNFGEYFNTLCLARPRFVHEVLKELDPKFKKNKKGTKSRFSLENRARKYFVDKISRKIDSNVAEERLDGLNVLKNLSSGFIDVYEGSGYDRLPGLQCYTLMMKPTPLQQGILEKLQNQRPVYKGFPLELELLITLGAIHPWLIRTTACSNQYFSPDELTALEKFKFDLKLGSKVRFVMSLVPRCLLRNEKVLIFCHNIAPINLFLEIFDRFYGWKKGEEVLVLQGDLELFERGRVMDRFEEPMGPSKVMLASITACAEGISLTAASRVILLDSEWNPSRSKQAIARAFRPGQDKVVYVYQLLANGTLEEEKFGRTTWKEWVSSMIFSEELVDDPSCWQAPKIEDELLREIVEEDRGTMFHMIMKNEKASNGLVRGKELAAHANNKDG